jgi:hypothetical protein
MGYIFLYAIRRPVSSARKEVIPTSALTNIIPYKKQDIPLSERDSNYKKHIVFFQNISWNGISPRR